MTDFFVFFKQRTADEMRISDWSSDVCSSDLACPAIPALSSKNDRPPPPDRQDFPMAETAACADATPVPADTARNAWRPWAGLAVMLTGTRSEERRVGTECVNTGRSRWTRFLSKKTHNT